MNLVELNLKNQPILLVILILLQVNLNYCDDVGAEHECHSRSKGESCDHDLECLPQFVCVADVCSENPTKKLSGFCHQKKEKESCTHDIECQENLECSYEHQVCIPAEIGSKDSTKWRKAYHKIHIVPGKSSPFAK